MRFWLVLLGMIIALSFMIAGCGDDDECATCPGAIKGFVNGSISLNPAVLTSDLFIYGNGTVRPDIDSIKIGDSLLTEENYISTCTMTGMPNIFWCCMFLEGGDTSTYMYDHGDLATIVFYGKGNSSTCNLKLLNRDSIAVNIISPLPAEDTLEVGESAVVTWNKTEYSDYYAIMVEFYDIVEGTTTWSYEIKYTVDTTYTVTSDLIPDSLAIMNISIVPFTGPNPISGGSNLSGNWLGGRLFSVGSSTMTIIYGWNTGTITRKTTSDIVTESHNWPPEEIIEQVYKEYE